MLCAVCVSMFQNPLKKGNHHTSFQNVILAADAGCKICKNIRRLRDDYSPEPSEGRETLSGIQYQFEEMGPHILHISLKGAVWLTGGMWRSIHLHVSGPKATPEWWPSYLETTKRDLIEEPWRVRPDHFPRRDIPDDTGAPKVMELAAEWMKICINSHPTCKITRVHQGDDYRPPRLLDVEEKGSKFCRLVDLRHETLIDNNNGYVALSHCWGKDPSFLTLTSDNMADMRRAISLESLPRSFVDSILACRQLGFQYLWIDSLCIVQNGPGSEEDWQFHAATMDQIYANCVLNIAVAHAENAEKGAFAQRDGDFLQTAFVYAPTHFDNIGEGATTPSVSIERSVSLDGNIKQNTNTAEKESATNHGKSVLLTLFASQYDHRDSLVQLPLERRGWVFQERIMSPRTLHFGKDRIYWECGECFRGEYLPYGLPESGREFDPYYPRSFSLPDAIVKARVADLDDAEITSLHNAWFDLLNDYSATHLTYPFKDKYVAITAIAKEFHRALKDQYVAGSFRTTLVPALLWSQEYFWSQRDCNSGGWSLRGSWGEMIYWDVKRDSNYRAPSWSWASVDGEVLFSSTRMAFGGLDVLQHSKKSLANVKNVHVELVDHRNPFGQVQWAELCIDAPMSEVMPPKKIVRIDFLDSTAEVDGKEDQLVALHIFQKTGPNEGNVLCTFVYGLVLAPTGEGTYRRVGFCLYQGPAGLPYPAAQFERATVKLV